MTRRPATRRPPRLASPEEQPERTVVREPTAGRRLLDSHVSGRQRIGRTEVLTTARRVVRGQPGALYELAPFPRLALDEVVTAIAQEWGPDLGSPELAAAVSIDPDRTLSRTAAAFGRVADVARRGGRLMFATTRPASLLALHQEVARLARAAGGVILADDESDAAHLDGRSGRHLRWLDGIAVATDGEALLGGPGFGAAAELLFRLPPPDLVVAERAVAGGALAAGIETVAFGGLDSVALGVAAGRGEPITLVPLDETRPPAAYAPLADVARDIFAGPAPTEPPTAPSG